MGASVSAYLLISSPSKIPTSLAVINKSFEFSDSSRANPIRGPPQPTPEYTILNAGCLYPESFRASRILTFALSVTDTFMLISRK